MQAGGGLTGQMPALSKLSALTYLDVSNNSIQVSLGCLLLCM